MSQAWTKRLSQAGNAESIQVKKLRVSDTVALMRWKLLTYAGFAALTYLENICSSSNASVHEQRHSMADGVSDRQDHVQCCR